MVGWPEITLLSRGGGSPIVRVLYFVKAQIQETITRILPEPEASLLTGILLGVESGIPDRVKNAFSTSGIIRGGCVWGQLKVNRVGWELGSE